MERAAGTRGSVIASLVIGWLLAASLLAATPVLAAKTMTIKPATLKTATATEPYEQTLSANGGTAPYTFTLESGSLPEGIALSPGGELTGTANTAGTSTFTMLATDSSSPTRTVSKTFSLTVALDLAPKSLHAYKAGAPVYVPLTASGGSGSYEFTLASGTLPETVSLSSEPGFQALSGEAYPAGTYTFAIQAKDKSTGATGTREYKLKVRLSMSPEKGSLPEASVGQSYFATANLVGGSGNYSYAVTEGALPEGLVLGQEQTSATFSGTPQKAESVKFTLTGTDVETGAQVSAKYRLKVSAIAFPKGLVELEEADKEGSFRGRDFVFFAITKEAKGLVHGTMQDGDGSTGKWTYTLATNAIDFDWPEISGSEGFPYHGTCSQASEECTGTQPFGTFVLRVGAL
ncbi:MAG TPA: Ig domain-containing protein [Solirubrobacteraceae bacterium]|jgi:hypothetical protein|nr:Ig domain-containing protein [Solirubrobacteraceae bacterium]